MPRPQRVQVPGGIYHLMSRGVRGEPLFTDDRERYFFIDLLGEGCTRYSWLLRAYCLMGNHYHLLVTTMDATLSRGMQWLNGRYAQWRNRRHGYEGHALFRRFKSVEVENDEHLAEVARYILLNPVRAGLCVAPNDWPWSSYRAMVGTEPVPPYLACNWIVRQFGFELRQAQTNFAAFVSVD